MHTHTHTGSQRQGGELGQGGQAEGREEDKEGFVVVGVGFVVVIEKEEVEEEAEEGFQVQEG